MSLLQKGQVQVYRYRKRLVFDFQEGLSPAAQANTIAFKKSNALNFSFLQVSWHSVAQKRSTPQQGVML